ncbi:hypothetical protein B4Q13_20995 [Lacticaseibacillus rhamnosus]
MSTVLSPAARPGYHAGRTPANAGKTYPAEILSPGEVSALLRACSMKSATGQRNQALVTILYRGGLRVSEALALFVDRLAQVRVQVDVLVLARQLRARAHQLRRPRSWCGRLVDVLQEDVLGHVTRSL